MQLAANDIVIDVPPNHITMRVSLRAAYRLERLYDGFSNLLHLVSGGNVSALAAVIREGAGESALTHFLDNCENVPLSIGLSRITAPCIEYIFALAGGEGDGKPADKPIPFEQHHANLFRIATGWLGWTPADAWDATPAEIIEAYRGRTELLAAIFGSKTDDDKGKATDFTSLKGSERASAMSRFKALGDLTVTRMPQ